MLHNNSTPTLFAKAAHTEAKIAFQTGQRGSSTFILPSKADRYVVGLGKATVIVEGLLKDVTADDFQLCLDYCEGLGVTYAGVGSWEGGRFTYIEPIVSVEGLDQAKELAKEYGQEFIFDRAYGYLIRV